MSRFPDHVTPITLRGGHEVAVGGNVVRTVRTSTTTEVRTRIDPELRDVVYCWDDATGSVLWTAQVRFESDVPAVLPQLNAIRSPHGCEIVVPSNIVNVVELDPGEYVVCWARPQDATELNVRCFDVECKVKWTIGVAEGKPFGVYEGVSLRPGNVLEAYGKSRGYLSVVDQQTGKVIETRPYH
jgi:hypothetical protein